MPDLLDRLKAALADRYAIEREIGAGGMATVYLAEDIKHHRPVAVKVLRPELAAVLGGERFLREIEITARLNHPHILTLLDSGEADGFLYYVMPVVESSLRSRLAREHQLPVEDALVVTRQVAAALDYAHRHDVIHRDIKPENILVHEGEAMVADFGIARAVTTAGGDRLTATGVAIGTPQYMSPEQAGGGTKDVDGRSDIYSLGCVLYEMLAGEPPFTGPTAESILQQHRAAPPPSVHNTRTSVPSEVSEVVQRALEKTPADRYATAARLATALPASTTARAAAAATRFRHIAAAITATALLVTLGVWVFARGASIVAPQADRSDAGTPRLAVLPFDNLSGAEDDYFADGISEEITSRIAEISGLRVISRQSAVQYKNSDKTLQQIGEELGVEYVLEGTIRTDRSPGATGQVRVTSQLIRVFEDVHLWTQRYTANLVPGEIFGVQEQIAGQVAEALDVTLLEPERQRLAAKPTNNQEAYDYLLRGNNYYGRSAEAEDIQMAIQMYQQAVELDPGFALAYARLSRAHSSMWWQFYDRTQERLAVAKAAVDGALRLDPDLPEAHEALGWYDYWGYLEYERALSEFAIAQKSQPNNGGVSYGIAAVQRRQGKTREALANFIRAAELDPRSAVAAGAVAETYILLRNPLEAARHFDRAISLSPDASGAYGLKVRWLHLRLEGNTEKARAVLEEARSAGGAEHLWTAYASVLLDVLVGDYQEALDRLALVSSEVLLDWQDFYLPKTQLYAQIFGLMGNRQREQAYYDSSRSMLQDKIQERPDDERFRSALGIAHAGLGRKEDAIREGELAVELLPMSREAWGGAYRVEDLARIHAMVGEYDAAIDQLESLLAVPSPTAVPMLRIDPTWDPLRDNPRFQALLAKYEN